jgi:hypothetical protein
MALTMWSFFEFTHQSVTDETTLAPMRDQETQISGTQTRSFLYGAAKKVNLVTQGQVLELEIGP